jgi:hypothetical protein
MAFPGSNPVLYLVGTLQQSHSSNLEMPSELSLGSRISETLSQLFLSTSQPPTFPSLYHGQPRAISPLPGIALSIKDSSVCGFATSCRSSCSDRRPSRRRCCPHLNQDLRVPDKVGKCSGPGRHARPDRPARGRQVRRQCRRRFQWLDYPRQPNGWYDIAFPKQQLPSPSSPC